MNTYTISAPDTTLGLYTGNEHPTFSWDDYGGCYGTIRLADVRYVITDHTGTRIGTEYITLILEGPSSDDLQDDWWNAIHEVEASLSGRRVDA